MYRRNEILMKKYNSENPLIYNGFRHIFTKNSISLNVYREKSKMLLFRELLKPLIYNGFWHIYTKNSILLNVYRRIKILIQKI